MKICFAGKQIRKNTENISLLYLCGPLSLHLLTGRHTKGLMISNVFCPMSRVEYTQYTICLLYTSDAADE